VLIVPMGRGESSSGNSQKSVQVDGGELPELPQSVKPNGNCRKIVIEEQCVITIDGKTYDLTKWADQHPGGPLIRQYNGLDATHIFHAFHSPQAHARLSQFKPLANPPSHLKPIDKDRRSNEILENYEILKFRDGDWKKEDEEASRTREPRPRTNWKAQEASGWKR